MNHFDQRAMEKYLQEVKRIGFIPDPIMWMRDQAIADYERQRAARNAEWQRIQDEAEARRKAIQEAFEKHKETCTADPVPVHGDHDDCYEPRDFEKLALTVGQLRKMLEGVPDELPVALWRQETDEDGDDVSFWSPYQRLDGAAKGRTQLAFGWNHTFGHLEVFAL